MINKIYDKFKNFIKENYKFLISLIIIYIVFTIKLPYVIYTPGGNINLNDRIEVDGGFDAQGTLNMAYVTVFEGTVPTLLLSYILPNWDIETKEDITLENQTYEELRILDKLQMESSIDLATQAAYSYAGKSLDIKSEMINIAYIDPAADTDLKVGDIITEVNGKSEEVFSELDKAISEKNIGDEITLTVQRDNKEKEIKSTIVEIDNEPKIGIVFVTTYDYDLSPELTITSKASESGPSGGLMLSLAIYNELVEEDITDGRKIVGTGTIEENGFVGEISGVKYKVLGSKNADIFLCPLENYEEAISVKEEYDLDMEIIGVNTFEEALEALK